MLYEIHSTKEVKKEHKVEPKAANEREEEEEQEAAVPLFTLLNNFLHSFFSNVEFSSFISKYTALMDCVCASLTILTISRGPSMIQRSFARRGV